MTGDACRAGTESPVRLTESYDSSRVTHYSSLDLVIVETDLDHFVFDDLRRGGDFDLVSDTLADQGLADRRLNGNPPVLQVGFVLACFAVTSVTLRPLIGALADRWSEQRVLTCGLLLLCGAVSLCFIPRAELTMLANALRGIGWASLSAGGYSLLALSAPPQRRGEASGYYSGVQASGTILFPAVALWLIDAPFGGFSLVFAAAMALAASGAVSLAVIVLYSFRA